MLRQRTLRAARLPRQTGKRLAGKDAGQVTDLTGPQVLSGEAFSRAVERFAEQRVVGRWRAMEAIRTPLPRRAG